MMKFCSWLWLVLFIVVSQGYAQDISEEKPMDTPSFRGGLHLGFSPYTGLLGLELSRGHWAATLGLPSCAGIKYYPDERGCRWFVGAHAMYFKIDDKETVDGVTYDKTTIGYAGLGLGYKWRWRNHWDLNLSASVAFHRRLLENDYMERREDYISFIPALTAGYTF